MRVVVFEDIGEVRFVKKRRVRNINLSVKADGLIHVTMPIYVAYSRAEEFVLSKQKWIVKRLNELKVVEEKRTVFTMDSPYKTKMHVLQLHQEGRENVRLLVQQGRIIVRFPTSIDVTDEIVQDVIRKGIEFAWRVEAKQILPERIEEYAKRFGFSYKQVKINRAKTRWGSCSHDNNINLSLFVMQLPEHLVDHILLHELVHTVHKNHSPKFWSALQEVSENAKELNKELKQYKIQVF